MFEYGLWLTFIVLKTCLTDASDLQPQMHRFCVMLNSAEDNDGTFDLLERCCK